MGKIVKNPKDHVFTFRANAETARLILQAAANHGSLSGFLLEAAEVKALDETVRVKIFDQLRSAA